VHWRLRGLLVVLLSHNIVLINDMRRCYFEVSNYLEGIRYVNLYMCGIKLRLFGVAFR